jgi:DNA-binding beta-propeller fold protein YncE
VFTGLDGAPFGVSVAPDGRFAFVDEINGRLAVVSLDGSTPRLTRTITVPGAALGNSLTPDGRYLLIADGASGATVVSMRRAENGSPNAVLGTLMHGGRGPGGGGAIEVASSADSDFVFVSLENAGTEAVYDLQAAAASHFKQSGYVGAVPVGIAPVGLALSPDGRWLYATSEASRPGTGIGTLSVIRVATGERNPAQAVVAMVPAKCSPVRVAVSADGGTVWMTARESDSLLAFSAAKLRSNPAHALLADVRVGEAPVGLALVNGGRDVVMADSDRFTAHERS